MPRYKKEGPLAVRFVKAIISGQFEPTSEGGKKFLAANQDIVSGEDPYSERQIEDNWRKAVEYLKLWYGKGEGYSPTFIRRCNAPFPTAGAEADRIRRILGVQAFEGVQDIPGDDLGRDEEAKESGNDEEDLNDLGHEAEEAEEAEEDNDDEDYQDSFEAEEDIPRNIPVPDETPAPAAMDDLSNRMSRASIKPKKSELEVKTVLKQNQVIDGDVVKTRDILVAQVTLPPGAVVKTTSIAPRPKDPNIVDLDVDIDPALSDGKSRVKPTWRRRNKPFAEEVESLFIKECKQGVVAKATPPYRHISESTRWPDGLKSELNPLDPHRLRLRKAPTPPDESLYEAHQVRTVNRQGEVVDAHLVTALFLVDKPTIQRASGGAGLRISGNDSDGASPSTTASSNTTTPSPNKRFRHGGHGASVPPANPYGFYGSPPYGAPPQWQSPPYWPPGYWGSPPPQVNVPQGHPMGPPPPQGHPMGPPPPQGPPMPPQPPHQGPMPPQPPPQGPPPPQPPMAPPQGPPQPPPPQGPPQPPMPPQGPPQPPMPPQGPPQPPPQAPPDSPNFFSGLF